MADDEDAAKISPKPQTSQNGQQRHHLRASAQMSVSPQKVLGASPRKSSLPLGVIPLPPGSRGPRSLYLRRQDNGFGFTLRHFIVYPPEQPFDDGATYQPMDTIFVKRVVEGGAGALAGLRQGDRIVAVNTQNINGLSYAQVVNLIKRSPPYLHLLVVPQQDDVLQKYFSATAHNPETNRRPSLQHEIPHRSLKRFAMFPQTGLEERRAQPQTPSQQSAEPQVAPVRRHSVRRVSEDSSTSESLHDDSIMSRLRKNFERKEAFLRREDVVIQREFYGRPQKLQKAVWPPDEVQKPRWPELDECYMSDSETLYQSDGLKGEENQGQKVVTNPRFASTLTRIHENIPSSVLNFRRQPDNSSEHSSESNCPYPAVVLKRTRQFESGRSIPDEEDDLSLDRTSLYTSELARLSSKRVVPNVAVRKREFEIRSEELSRELRRERESLQRLGGGNMTIPIGSKHLHCPPPGANMTIPIGSKHLHCPPPENDYESISSHRGRSNSTGSWSTRKSDNEGSVDEEKRQNDLLGEVKGRVHMKKETLDWYATQAEKLRNKAVRQNSYLAAVRGPSVKETPSPVSIKPDSIRPTHLQLSQPLDQHFFNDSDSILHIDDISTDSGDIPEVVKRTNLSVIGDEERATRRVSYLKATLGERLLENDVSDTEEFPKPQALRRNSCSPRSASPATTAEIDSTSSADLSILDKENRFSIIKDGALHCKVTLQDGKRATDRSWKQAWVVLNKLSQLFLYRHHQSPMGQSDPNADLITTPLDVRYSVIEIASDYTKRKNVLRVSNTGTTEILLQADTETEMYHWLESLQEQTKEQQVAVPQQVPAATTILVQGATRLSLGKFNRSPWGRVVKQFRKIHHGSSSPASTIGIPIELCPSSTISEFIPLLVEVCTGIVEERGLDVIGIYRVPGNTAAITLLTDEVNRGFTPPNLQDPRWQDVNVVSSLLKSFFRRLPDSLFTTALYPKFIESDKIENGTCRLMVLRKLLFELPEHHYETLKYLMLHLKKVVENAHKNKMEARNLAIVFGPTLVRAGDDNMVTMVTDMQHQCKIIESLLIYVDWFFSEHDLLPPTTDFEIKSMDNESLNSSTNHSLLLNNIEKIEGMRSSPKDVAKSITSNIISAAHRKIQKSTKPTPKVNIEVPTEVRVSQDRPDGTIRSYAGLSATTQERIRRFEVETRAMLARRGVEEVDKMEWMSYDSSIRRGSSVENVQASRLNNTSLKRLKTGKEMPSGSSNIQLQQRCGSLESLNRVPIPKQDQPGRSTDLSDDGSDLLTSLTTTFDHKLKSLLSSSPPKPTEPIITNEKPKLFRNPSLHKTESTISHKLQKEVAETEKDEEEIRPDNDRIKLKRSESLNRDNKLHRVDSLTKNEKTESNINKKRESKRKIKSIKRRHTVGGTKDFDCNRLNYKNTTNCNRFCHNYQKDLRTSSPDLTRRERFLLEVNLSGPEGMIVALRKHLVAPTRPQSLPESRLFKVPLESHV